MIPFESDIQRVLEGLNQAEIEDLKNKGYDKQTQGETFEKHYKWHIGRNGKKYICIDCGTSGAFLMMKNDGELFNIKSYGVADLNKKKKADIGNIKTVDPKELHSKRWNYLR